MPEPRICEVYELVCHGCQVAVVFPVASVLQGTARCPRCSVPPNDSMEVFLMALPWFRVYSDLLNSRKFHRLSDTLKARLLYLWCLAAKNDGILPGIEDVAFALRIPEDDAQKTIEDLSAAGLLDRTERGMAPHDWDEHQHVSDVSTGRVKRFREKNAGGMKRTAKRNETVSGNTVKPFLKRNETVQEQTQSRADSEQKQNTPSAAETAAALKLAEETFDLGDSERAQAWNGTGDSGGTSKKSLLNPEIESALVTAAGRIHSRHPTARRCGLGEVKNQLRAIVRHAQPGKRLGLLRQIDENHAGWCETPDWQKENGQYAKGLDNWLAPTKGRWEESPPRAPLRDGPKGHGGSTIDDEFIPPGVRLPQFGDAA